MSTITSDQVRKYFTPKKSETDVFQVDFTLWDGEMIVYVFYTIGVYGSVDVVILPWSIGDGFHKALRPGKGQVNKIKKGGGWADVLEVRERRAFDWIAQQLNKQQNRCDNLDQPIKMIARRADKA